MRYEDGFPEDDDAHERGWADYLSELSPAEQRAALAARRRREMREAMEEELEERLAEMERFERVDGDDADPDESDEEREARWAVYREVDREDAAVRRAERGGWDN